MAFNLRLNCSGLCALVPDAKRKELCLVLVETSTPKDDPRLARRRLQFGMHTHRPFLAVGLANLVPGNRRQPDYVVPDLRGNALGIFNLGYEELTFHTGSHLILESYDRRGLAPRTEREAGNLQWIPRFPDLKLRAPLLDRGILTGFAPEVAVHTRARIPGGHVRSLEVNRCEDGFNIFDFKVGARRKSLHRQALTERVIIEMTVDDGGSTRPQIGSSRRGGAIRLLRPALSDWLDISIGHLPDGFGPMSFAYPAERHAGMEHDHSMEHGHAMAPTYKGGAPSLAAGATHFRWFYELLPPKSRPALDQRPIPFPSRLGAMMPGTSTCPFFFGDVAG